MPLEIAINQPSVVCATYENIYLDLWWEGATAPVLQEVRKHRLQFMSKRAGPLYSCAIVYAGKMRAIPKDVRDELGLLFQESKERFLADAIVVPTSALLISAIRMILLGVRLVTRSQHTMEFFSALPPAVDWLASLAKVEPIALQNAIQEATNAHLR